MRQPTKVICSLLSDQYTAKSQEPLERIFVLCFAFIASHPSAFHHSSSSSFRRALFRNSTWARTWVQNNKYFRVIAKGVAQDGWKFVLLARFSPMPSYIVNYSLAATDVRYFVDFLMPSILGCVPMILQNTSIGSLTKAATTSVADGGEKKAGIGAYLLPLIGVISSLLIAWRIKKYTSNQVVALTSKSLSSSSMSSTDVSE